MKISTSIRYLLLAGPALGVTALFYRLPSLQAKADTLPAPSSLAKTVALTQEALPPNGQNAPEGYVPLAKGTLTFDKQIAPIIYSNCATCHRPEEVAPFSLLTYQDVKKRAKQIAQVTQSGFMPPWKADEGKEKFLDAHRLSMAEIGMIGQWADEGAPEGKATDLPPAPQFAPGWQNGTPDVVLQPEEPYHLAAEGDDVYRCFVIPTNYTEDRWVAAMEVRPGNRSVVHHVIAYLDTSGRAREKDAADPGPGYTSFGGIGIPPSGALGGWAPGMVPRLAPPGDGIFLPKGADIVLQVHYHKGGKPEVDQTKIGLYFAKGPVDKRIRNLLVLDRRLYIPAGDANYTATGTTTIPADITALSVTPHMHLLGKAMKVTATLPDGTTQKLVNVNDYDFNWQMSYGFKDALKLPAGTRLDMSARYDNTADNPSNPSNPPRNVTWGEQTTDEMCIAFLSYTVDSEHLTKGEAVGPLQTMRGLGENGGGLAAGGGATAGGGAARQRLLQKFDTNGDGKLDATERQAALQWWRDHQGAQ